MATVFESISLTGFRLAHLRQLQAYIHERDRDEWHYGHKKQFENRHADLIKWIDNAVSYAEEEGIVFPNKEKYK